MEFENGEKVIKIVRRHYFVIMPMILNIMIAALAPLIIYSFFISNILPFDKAFIKLIVDFFEGYKTFWYSLWLLILWTVLFIEWTDYYLDLWVITDRKIVDVEQKGFFHREITSFNYAQIQDITVETKGLIETFFKFGTLNIQTAGHGRDIIINDAHFPEEAKALILKLREQSQGQREAI